jgi:hypothetical protein
MCIRDRLPSWTGSADEYVRTFGYAVLSSLLRDEVPLDDSLLSRYLEKIEREIHQSPNQARHAMNGALMSIGIARPALQEKAIAAARRIGKVLVDHGDTSCKTPDAEQYILKAAARRQGAKPPPAANKAAKPAKPAARANSKSRR